MTSEEAFLGDVVSRLTAAGIAYMVAGSLASGVHGEPRSTLDTDLVIDATPAQLEAFLDSLPRDYYVSPDAARDALRRRVMFNIIDPAIGWKIDLIFSKDTEFAREQFRRRVTAQVGPSQLFVSSAEDVILSKLEWSREGGSQKQYRDALGVAKSRLDALDRGYLYKWADQIQVRPQLDRLLADAEQWRLGQ
jgi:hypothetical protein